MKKIIGNITQKVYNKVDKNCHFYICDDLLNHLFQPVQVIINRNIRWSLIIKVNNKQNFCNYVQQFKDNL
jgi:hypothetical protein